MSSARGRPARAGTGGRGPRPSRARAHLLALERIDRTLLLLDRRLDALAQRIDALVPTTVLTVPIRRTGPGG